MPDPDASDGEDEEMEHYRDSNGDGRRQVWRKMRFALKRARRVVRKPGEPQASSDPDWATHEAVLPVHLMRMSLG